MIIKNNLKVVTRYKILTSTFFYLDFSSSCFFAPNLYSQFDVVSVFFFDTDCKSEKRTFFWESSLNLFRRIEMERNNIAS